MSTNERGRIDPVTGVALISTPQAQ